MVGDQNNRKDKYHSTVQIKEDDTGIIFEEMHIDKIPKEVKVGTKIKAGQPIGKPSCETQPGGFTTGIHIHIGLINSDGTRPPINGMSFSGWTIDGDIMSKPGEQNRTATTGRCDTNIICSGIRNDLTNEPSKEVKGASVTPTQEPIISTAIPTPRTPVISPTTASTKPAETGCIPNPPKIRVSSVEIKNFLSCSKTIEDTGEVFITERSDYVIIFHKNGSNFLINLLSSPFEAIRKKAEDDLISILEISNKDACSLNVVTKTPRFANPEQAGRNYPLTFCPK